MTAKRGRCFTMRWGCFSDRLMVDCLVSFDAAVWYMTRYVPKLSTGCLCIFITLTPNIEYRSSVRHCLLIHVSPEGHRHEVASYVHPRSDDPARLGPAA